MIKVLVCKHVPQEGLGYFEQLFKGSGIDFDYQELYTESRPRRLHDYQGLVVMGGPMNVYQEDKYPFLKTDLYYIEEALRLNLPMLGFCLGAQLFSRVLGGIVSKNEHPELGWYDLVLTNEESLLLKGFPNKFKVFEWHEDTFSIPPGGKLLASSDTCRNQAFAWGTNVYGLQFHLELDGPMVCEWLKDDVTVSRWGFDAKEIALETKTQIETEMELGKKLVENFQKILWMDRF